MNTPMPLRCAPLVAALAAAPALAGCPRVAPPASAFPTADAALERARATQACATGLQASAKIDHFGRGGRFRGDLLMFAARPAQLRMDVVSPFGVALATLTSDATEFKLADLRDKRFYVGPAKACNIARLTGVPLPGYVLVDLLRGAPPVLKHEAMPTSIEWHRRGYYVVSIASTRQARQEIHLVPHPDDFARPWQTQRVRLLEVQVWQYGRALYRAELDDHTPAKMAAPRIDPDGIDPPIAPSGPPCAAELPRRIHVEVPDQDADVLFRYDEVTWNPPLPAGTFTQRPPEALTIERVDCQ